MTGIYCYSLSLYSHKRTAACFFFPPHCLSVYGIRYTCAFVVICSSPTCFACKFYVSFFPPKYMIIILALCNTQPSCSTITFPPVWGLCYTIFRPHRISPVWHFFVFVLFIYYDFLRRGKSIKKKKKEIVLFLNKVKNNIFCFLFCSSRIVCRFPIH